MSAATWVAPGRETVVSGDTGDTGNGTMVFTKRTVMEIVRRELGLLVDNRPVSRPLLIGRYVEYISRR